MRESVSDVLAGADALSEEGAVVGVVDGASIVLSFGVPGDLGFEAWGRRRALRMSPSLAASAFRALASVQVRAASSIEGMWAAVADMTAVVSDLQDVVRRACPSGPARPAAARGGWTTIQKPTLGRIVLFSPEEGRVLVGLVVGVSRASEGRVDLRTLTFGPSTTYGASAVPYGSDGRAGTWRYPSLCNEEIEVWG